MNKFFLLTKIQLKGSLAPDKLFHLNQSKKRAKAAGAFVILMFVLLTMCSGLYAFGTATMLKKMNALDYLPGLWITITSLILLFTNIYKVKGALFSFADYDMVMAMPVKTSTVVASRISTLYVIDLLFTVIIMVPGSIAYGMLAKASLGYYFLSLFLILWIPIVPILIGTILGLIVTVVSSRFRYSNLVTLGLLIAVFAGYMYFMFTISNSPAEDAQIMDFTSQIGKQVTRAYPIADLYMLSVTKFDFLAMIEFVGISAVLMSMFCYLLGKSFKKLNTVITASGAKSNYKMTELKTSSVLVSIYKKEVKRYFASPMYVMNTGVGLILLTVATIVIMVAGPEQMTQMLDIPMVAEQIAYLIPVLMLLCCCMNTATASLISLEGKNLWIYRSLPLHPFQILQGKILMNLTLSIPLIVIDAILFGWKLHMKPLLLIITFVLPVAGAVVMSYVGLILNLWFPRFDWKSELEIAKQGLPTMISLFGGMLIGIGPGILLFVIKRVEAETILLSYAAVLILLGVALRDYIKTKGSKLFESLNA